MPSGNVWGCDGEGRRCRSEDSRPLDLNAGPVRPGAGNAADHSLLEHTAVPFQDAAGRMFSTESYRPAAPPLNRSRTIDPCRRAPFSGGRVEATRAAPPGALSRSFPANSDTGTKKKTCLSLKVIRR